MGRFYDEYLVELNSPTIRAHTPVAQPTLDLVRFAQGVECAKAMVA
jgi:hypothetical protein